MMGGKAIVWRSEGKEYSPIFIKNDLGICVVLPFKYNEKNGNATVIEVE